MFLKTFKKIPSQINIMENQGLNYYQRNKTKILERQKKYNKEHQQECIDRNKKYYNKDYFREYYHKKKVVELSTT
jgi:hypothetical protein